VTANVVGQFEHAMSQPLSRSLFDDSASPANRRYRWLKRFEIVWLMVGLCAFASDLGQPEPQGWSLWRLSTIIITSLAGMTVSCLWRTQLVRNVRQYVIENRITLLVYGLWAAGMILSPVLVLVTNYSAPWYEEVVLVALRWSEFCLLLRFGIGASETARDVYQLGWNPAVLLVLSFVALNLLGTALLWLPSSRNPGATVPEHISPLLAALYTSISASCVTGLVIVDTYEYWSFSGQLIILSLIQLGGLGILTFGGFVALVSGREMQVGEGAMYRDLFEADQVAQVRRMVISILAFTLISELIGAVLLWGLWPELPLGQRAYFCIFHSVAAFCNAGFSLHPHNLNLLGYGLYWQVWAVIPALIIIGGLGFGTLYEGLRYLTTKFTHLFHREYFRGHRTRARLSISAGLALLTTLALLVLGTIILWITDVHGGLGKLTFWESLSGAWFQSVTCRTAGFNTVDINLMTPTSKMVMIILMFIGASPVSTGGGVKTVSFAVAILALRSILIGRARVEIWGRTISDPLVKRASTIIGSALIVVLTTTLLITYFENRGELFLDHLFEATSAFGTVGLSTGISPRMTVPSLLVVALTMFIGRVGPLTLFVAVAGRETTARYQYPEEKITLG